MLLRMSYVRLTVFASTMTLAAACGDSCCTPPKPPGPDGGTAPTITFGPTPAVVHCADDIDPNTPGEQIEVTVPLADDDGSGYANATVTNSFDGSSGSGDFNADGEATVVVTLTGSASGTNNTLTATSSNGNADADLT